LGVPGQGGHAAGWHRGQVQLTHTELMDLAQPVQGTEQPGGGDAGGSAAQPLQTGGARRVLHVQQPVQVVALLLAGQGGEVGMQLLGGLVADGGDEPLEQAGPGQQHLGLDEAGSGPVEQHAGPIRGGAGQACGVPGGGGAFVDEFAFVFGEGGEDAGEHPTGEVE